jgi:EcoRII C terminal
MSEQKSIELLAEFDAARITAAKLFRLCNGIPSAVILTRRAIGEALGEPPYDREYIKDHFSELVHDLQIAAYGFYLAAEREICGSVLSAHVRSRATADSSAGALAALKDSFFDLDRFFLSLTQSRRQRAGASFEAVVKTLFEALGYPHTAQPELSGSRPDFVLPSLEHYQVYATDCVIFTCKRTLRERWRQVITEGLTGQAFYLATIDEGISVAELNRMRERNVIVVVPQALKAKHYGATLNVASFENFFDQHLDPAVARWKANGVI